MITKDEAVLMEEQKQICVNILDSRNHDSGKLETDIPDVGNRLNSA